MGTAEAEIYLASPAVVAASAIAGRIALPEEVIEAVDDAGPGTSA